MNGPTEPNFEDPTRQITRQVAPTDWERAELEAQSAPIVPREPLFPRKVLIGWALFALALYFGVKLAGIAIKEGFRAAVNTAAQSSDGKDIIFQSRNGKVTISRDKPNGSITIHTSGGPGKPSKTITIPGEAVTIQPPPKPPATATPPQVAPPVQPAKPTPAKR